MLQSLLLVKSVVSLLVCFLTVTAFNGPIENLAVKALTQEFWSAWKTLIYLSVYVVGLSRGVLVAELERYTRPAHPSKRSRDRDEEMTQEKWILEVVKTVLESLKAVALMLLAFLAASSVILLLRMKFGS
jgi:hypothetical protein